MGAVGGTFVILFVISIPLVTWLAHGVGRPGIDDGPLTTSGWIACTLLGICFLCFFIVAADQFGPVVWFLVILAIWITFLYAIFSEFRSNITGRP